MQFLQVFVTAFLLWEADLKAVNKKQDMIFPQDYLHDYSTREKKQYIPFIDGQPILIPEEFASEKLDLREKESNNPPGLDKTDLPIFKMDQVFLVDQNSYLQHPQKPIQNKNKKQTEIKDFEKPKPNKRTKICKASQKSKIKKATETKKEHLAKEEPQNILIEKVDLNKKDGMKTESDANLSSSRNIFKEKHGDRSDIFESVDESDIEEHLSLQDEVKSMFGPSFKSFVFNPLAPAKSKFQECKTSKNESGVCRYVQHCFLPSIVSSIQQFMNNVCIIETRFIGVCCPEFPVQAVPVKWKQTSFDDQETFNDQIKTPEECGVGTNTRIVGGSDANVKAYPWMVALINNKKDFFCGGALINNRYVLTAAHCTFGVKNDEIIARVGEYDLRSDQGDDYRVVEIKRHGQYNRFTLRNDVALLKLEKPVTFNEFVKTVCFPDPTINYTGKIATLAGWGRLQGGVSPFTSDILQEVEFPIVTNEECSSTHGLPIPESLICTSAPSKDKSACNGDSGGPLMMLDNENRWKVVGIVSWGRRGCNTKFPSVFTRVTNYLDWIKQHAT